MKHKSGLLFGLVAGTALGILFAPKKGKQMRADIKRERTLGGYGTQAVKAGFVDMGKEILDSAKAGYESEEVQAQIENAKKSAARLAEDSKERIVKTAKKRGKTTGRSAKKAASKAASKAAKSAKSASKKARKFTKKKIGK